MTHILSRLHDRYAYSLIILKQLVITDFKLRYKGSVLGYVWTLLKPLALFAVMYLVFVRFLKFGADIPHFAVALLLGTVLWNFFSEATLNGMTAIVGKGDLMRKLSFPRYVVVLASLASALINLCINLVVIGFFIVLNGVQLNVHALAIVPIVLELTLVALGVSLLLGALYVKLRDINYIWELVLQAGFYATPIFYPIAKVTEVSEGLAKLMMMNPLAQIIQDARWALISDTTPTVSSMLHGSYKALIPYATVVIICLVGVAYFKAQSAMFAEDI